MSLLTSNNDTRVNLNDPSVQRVLIESAWLAWQWFTTVDTMLKEGIIHYLVGGLEHEFDFPIYWDILEHE